ncbi:MAG: DUF2116 family Zn-ribbon domain-containing protein [Flavobacterium sp.]|nr:MAG: DUF2116 family Zn-ribbon domain-containing protein [Flavobacterium sp.]
MIGFTLIQLNHANPAKNQKENKGRHCLFCEKPIPKNSRLEKVYCNVDCKNKYNSRKQQSSRPRPVLTRLKS